MNYGYIKSPKDFRDYKLNKRRVAAAANLPNEYAVNISDIKNQGQVSSCVAHSLAEILEAYNGHEKYSTAWIYGYRPFGYYQDLGMIPSQAMKTINKVGYLDYDSLPGNVELPTAKEIVDKNLSIYERYAAQRKILSYAKLRSVNEIKQAIYASNLPVFIAINIGVNGLLLDKDGVAVIPEETEGGHALVCYGWNSKGLLIQNSWGSRWGNKGCFILPYTYPVSEAWVITPQKPKDEQSLVKKPCFFNIRSLLQLLFG